MYNESLIIFVSFLHLWVFFINYDSEEGINYLKHHILISNLLLIKYRTGNFGTVDVFLALYIYYE